MKLEFIQSSETAASRETFALLKEVASIVCPDAEIYLETDARPDAGAFSLKIDGRFVQWGSAADAVPPRWHIEAELLRSTGPGGLLFLCVANSARSQMGEGVARLLAPNGVRVQSAGSHPTSVRPEAAVVLSELGIDTKAHFSKNVSDIDPETVDTVITLCAEEECPVFLGRAVRLHWGLPDPAAVSGSEAERLNAFRDTRDELNKRLRIIWPTKD